VQEEGNSNAPLIALVLLLLLGLGAMGWLILLPDQAAAPPAPAPVDNAPVAKDQPPPRDTLKPDTPPEQPKAAPEPDPSHVALPALTRFRRLVLEADAAFTAAEPPAARSDAAWRSFSTLDQLESRYAPHARRVFDGRDTARERADFQALIRTSFANPDVATSSFDIRKSERVALWLRNGVELPDAEPVPVVDSPVPINRRLQEHVDVPSVASWLAAIENEFGKTPFGVGGLPLDIVMLPDAREYMEFSRKRLHLDVPAWSAGLFSSRWQVVCLPVLKDVSVAEVVRHEMFHAAQAMLAPESLLVPWFAEGAAEWLDKAPPQGGVLRTHTQFAAAAWGYLAGLMDGGYEINLREFLAQELAQFYTNPQLNYLLAYCWVDFVRTEADLRPVYFQFWELLKQGVGREQAFARTFGALNFNDLTARFIARAKAAERNNTPPRFAHDAHDGAIELLPPNLGGAPRPPSDPDAIDAGWFGVLAELQRRGFDTARAGPLGDHHDILFVVIDSSETMARKIEDVWFDWDGFSRWLFALRASAQLTFNRKDSATSENVPPAMQLTMVEAVLTGRVKDFSEATGVRVDEKLQSELQRNYEKFEWPGDELKPLAKRELCRLAADSMAWYWGTRQSNPRVVVIDFNTKAKVEIQTASLDEDRSGKTLLARMFEKTAANASPAGADGIDCDWWLGLTGVTKHVQDNGATAPACIFFTDGPNSSGAYGHPESGRSEENYLKQQASMAEDYALEWVKARLNESKAVLQLVALPGAENQGLDYLPQKVAEAKVDLWAQRFRK
jgi:hypothetical protein